VFLLKKKFMRGRGLIATTPYMIDDGLTITCYTGQIYDDNRIYECCCPSGTLTVTAILEENNAMSHQVFLHMLKFPQNLNS